MTSDRTRLAATARRLRNAGGAVLSAFLLTGCTDAAGHDLDMFWGKFSTLSTLRESVALDPYESPRLPAEGTVPVVSPNADRPEPSTQAQLDSVGRVATFPMPVTPELLTRGKLQFERNCTICHGPGGAGDGPIIGQGRFPFAPGLVQGAAAARTDGYLYGVTRVGRGFMPSYGERMTEPDIWAVVAYLRHLQGRPIGSGAGQAAGPESAAPAGGVAPTPAAVTTPAAPGEPGTAAPNR